MRSSEVEGPTPYHVRRVLSHTLALGGKPFDGGPRGRRSSFQGAPPLRLCFSSSKTCRTLCRRILLISSEVYSSWSITLWSLSASSVLRSLISSGSKNCAKSPIVVFLHKKMSYL